MAVTEGIRVSVEPRYLRNHSDPTAHHFMFSYTVRIANEGSSAAKLETRHWVITDATGYVEEVRGPGVVGETPHLEPGQEFTYTSGCALRTPRGTMHGSYQMVRDNGDRFDAEIAPFVLAAPTADPQRYLN